MLGTSLARASGITETGAPTQRDLKEYIINPCESCPPSSKQDPYYMETPNSWTMRKDGSMISGPSEECFKGLLCTQCKLEYYPPFGHHIFWTLIVLGTTTRKHDSYVAAPVQGFRGRTKITKAMRTETSF